MQASITEEDHRRKRQKLSSTTSTLPSKNLNNQTTKDSTAMDLSKPAGAMASRNTREEEVGILQYVNTTNPGFTGVLKQRYTDFLVNEITEDGTVIHLTDTSMPKPVHRQQEVKTESEATATVNEASETVSAKGQEKAAPQITVVDDHVKPEETTTAKLDTEMTEAINSEVEPKVDAAPEVKTSGDHAPVKTEVEAAKEDAQDGKTEADYSKVEEAKDPNDQAEKPAEGTVEEISEDDQKLLTTYFGAEVRDSILALYKKVLQRPDGKAASYGTVTSEPIKDRQLRTQIHQNVRRIFKSTFETSLNDDGTMKVAVAGKLARGGRQDNSRRTDFQHGNQMKGKLGWAERGGEHLHFSLLKENKDTMEVISFLANSMRVQPKSFAFAGTKDRRGVTVQRVSLFRGDAKKLLGLNKDLRGSKVGGLKYEKHGLSLGDLQGNEFVVTLRDCHFPGEPLDENERLEAAAQIVEESVKNMNKHGFLNYYGLQRFGAFSTGTDEVGKLILKGDFRGAVQAIMAFNPDLLDEEDNSRFGRDDIARAIAIDMFDNKGNNDAALRKMPKKFSAESAILRWLKGQRQNDYIGALQSINRGLRMMYVHAYQSLVWNRAASERWARFGDKVVEGDLVLVESKDAKNGNGKADAEAEEVDETGEVIVKPASDDVAASFEDQFQRARHLSKEEALSGDYSIFDIVLPTPGYDVEYPNNEIGDFYNEFMASEEGGGLDPMNMRRSQKDFSLSGSYRKLLGLAKDVSFEVKLYSEELEQMVETDLDRFYKGKPRPLPPQRFPQQPRFQPTPRFGHRQPQSQLPQTNAWANFKGSIAESDKAMADEAKARKAAAALEPPKEPRKVEDSFIETSGETGKRTGHRETVVKELKPLAAQNDSTSDAEAGKLASPEDIPLPATPAPESNAAKVIKYSIDQMVNIGQQLKTLAGQKDSEMSGMAEKKDVIAAPEEVALPATPQPEFTVDIQRLKRSADQMDSEMSGVDQVETKDAVKELEAPKLNPEVAPFVPEVKEEPTTVVDSTPVPKKLAVIVTFKLGSSQYATMALRELMKSGGVQEYKSGFAGR